ncbi:hypothetical protein [Brevundimonas sp.]|jgi:hypothetical protein|uniref:hypothetical protein n=1 Tax=Brevundimonas sp. TaxID=1871086 RepID=UPI0037BF423A
MDPSSKAAILKSRQGGGCQDVAQWAVEDRSPTGPEVSCRPQVMMKAAIMMLGLNGANPTRRLAAVGRLMGRPSAETCRSLARRIGVHQMFGDVCDLGQA